MRNLFIVIVCVCVCALFRLIDLNFELNKKKIKNTSQESVNVKIILFVFI